MPTQVHEVIWFEGLGRADVAVVGGKNAALGYMVRHLGQPFHWLCHFAGLLALCRGELIEKHNRSGSAESSGRLHPFGRPGRRSAARLFGPNGRRKQRRLSSAPSENSAAVPARRNAMSLYGRARLQPAAWKECPPSLRHVRDPLECHPSVGIRRTV